MIAPAGDVFCTVIELTITSLGFRNGRPHIFRKLNSTQPDFDRHTKVTADEYPVAVSVTGILFQAV